MPMPMGEFSEAVIRMAKREDGVTMRDVVNALGVSVKTASAKCGDLCKYKKLFRAKVEPLPTHYFASETAKEAWRLKQKVKPAGHWQMSLPGTPKPIQPVKETLPFKGTIQRCPHWTHDPRYTLGPGEKPPPLFSALPIGTYLEA